jgi:hypothetical protein
MSQSEESSKKPISMLTTAMSTIAVLLITSVKGMGIPLDCFDVICGCLASDSRAMAISMLPVAVNLALKGIAEKSQPVSITVYRILATLLDLANLLGASQEVTNMTNEKALGIMTAPDVYKSGQQAGLTVDGHVAFLMLNAAYQELLTTMNKETADKAVFALANNCADSKQKQSSYDTKSDSEFPTPANRGPVIHPSRMPHFNNNNNNNSVKKHCIHCTNNKKIFDNTLFISPSSHNTDKCNHSPTLQADGTYAPAKPYSLYTPSNNQNRQPRQPRNNQNQQSSAKSSYMDQLNNNIQ